MSSHAVLVDVARRDARLFQLKQQIANLPRKLQELDAERARLEVQAREAEGRWQQTETARRKLEHELGEVRQRRTKSESRLATLTSTEQYQALVKEIAAHAARIDELESQVLEAIDRSEQAERGRDAEKARVEQVLAALVAQRQQLHRDLEMARAALPAETRDREASLARVDAATRSLYERILKAKGDAGLSLVTGPSCGICKAVQPPQTLQLLRQATGTQVCQMCGRILVWDPEAA